MGSGKAGFLSLALTHTHTLDWEGASFRHVTVSGPHLLSLSVTLLLVLAVAP